MTEFLNAAWSYILTGGLVGAVVGFLLLRFIRSYDTSIADMRKLIDRNSARIESGDVTCREQIEDLEREIRERDERVRDRIHSVEVSMQTVAATHASLQETLVDMRGQLRDFGGKIDGLYNGLLRGEIGPRK